MKRAKYQDESTKVSIVSVSRTRRAAAARAGDMLPGRMAVERIARLVEGDVIGQQHRQIRLRHRRPAPQVGAMDDRDRAAPVALARDAPVAQAEIDLAGGPCGRPREIRSPAGASPPPLAAGMERPSRNLEWSEMAVAVIGLVARLRRSRRSAPLGQHDRRDRQAVLLRAKSRSRWSCAGQPKMAPVP